jgi:hypothetical protein
MARFARRFGLPTDWGERKPIFRDERWLLPNVDPSYQP